MNTLENLSEHRQSHLASLSARLQGLDWCHTHSEIADDVVRAVHRGVEASMPDPPPLAVVATGGYGRRELAPYSDIDITVVPLDEAHPSLDSAVRALFKELHAAFEGGLKLDVGYAYRLISDAPGLDAKTRTGLLDARLVSGSSRAFVALMSAVWESLPAGEFLIEKIREREAAFHRFHDTPLVVEPQLKEGAGGLRCFHSANWMGAVIGERASRPTPEFDHIVALRNALHRVAGKATDLLSRARQAEVADLHGLDMYAMMSEAASAALSVHAEYGRALERVQEARFSLSEGVVALRGEARISGGVRASRAAVGIAVATQLGLRVPDLPAAAATEVNGPEALFSIRCGERTMRNLDRCGLLEALLPELTRTRTLMPDDTAHDYTVFEHSLRVVRKLDELEPGSFLGDLKATLHDDEPLYLAALLHDAGKALPGRPHSETGEVIAQDVTARWALSPSIRDAVCWLVRDHLTMAKTIRMRDVMNPMTAQEFATVVKDQERLDLLTLLTYADIAAVNAEAWTPATESFLKELYVRTSAVLQSENPQTPDPAVYRKRLQRELRGQAIPEAEVQAFLESLPAHYVISTPPELVPIHIAFARRALAGDPAIELFHQPELGATEVTVCCLDAPGLLSRMLGVLYAFDLSLYGIRAGTTATEPPVALDVFQVSFGGKPIPQATGQQLAHALRNVIQGEKDVEELLRLRGKDAARKQEVFDYSYAEGNPGILEIRAPRGRGMAYRFSRLIAAQGWNIHAARVGQWAGRGAAAFYVAGPDNQPLTRSEVDRALAQGYSH